MPSNRTAPAAELGVLLQTRLYPPQWHSALVSRPGLASRIARGTQAKLTLISAPPGFGKSTLLAEWLAGEQRPIAWVSLDESDDNPVQFWTMATAAIAGVTGLHGDANSQAEPQTARTLLANVLPWLADGPRELVLVLDDYHVITSPAIHEELGWLIDDMPRTLHIVISSRADPPLALPRLRVRGELEEVRAADLRFSSPEMAAFFDGAVDSRLTSTQFAELERQTEGWIAALKLVALSLRGRADVQGFISGFSGEDRYIVDYLVEEVLRVQTAEVRDFLLRTSVLSRMSTSLCNVLTGRSDSRTLLEGLERANLFVIPLDDRRQWYRYHHLFADVLRAHLAEELPPADISTLHRRASEWFEQQGEAAEAIRHAFAADDYPRAARLVEANMRPLRRTRQESVALDWIQRIPGHVLRQRPVLCVEFAGVLLACHRSEDVEEYLHSAEEWLAGASGQDARVTAESADFDLAELLVLPSWIALYRSALAQMSNDADGTTYYSRKALELSLPDDHALHGAASALLGLALWGLGDLEGAYAAYAEGMSRLYQAGYISDVVGGSIAMAELRMAQGRLTAAAAIYQAGLDLAERHGQPAMRGTADMQVGLAEVAYERNALESANEHLARGRALGEAATFPQNRYRRALAMARLAFAAGDYAEAESQIAEAERYYVSDFYPNTKPISAMRVRLWIVQGRLAEAEQWATQAGVTLGDQAGVLHEYEHLTFARLLIARDTASDRRLLSAFLQRLLEDAERGNRRASVIEVLILQAIAFERAGDSPEALLALERVIRLAEPEGFVRVFLDEGPPMRALLQAAVASGAGGEFARQILTGFETAVAEEAAIAPESPHAAAMAEQLTPREFEILGFLASGMQNQQIAEHLVLSVATVKRHVANIYGKLEVGHRTAAINRARDLGLL